MIHAYPRDVPDQPPLWPIDWPTLEFVLRRHHATRLHWDLRIRAKGVLYSWWMLNPPSFDPERPVRLGLAGPHHPRWMYSERCIPQGKAGSGPTLVEDFGRAMPLRQGAGSQDQRLHDAFIEGRIDLRFEGGALQGAFVLCRDGEDWWLWKVEDEYASKEPHGWSGVSPLSGRTLDDL